MRIDYNKLGLSVIPVKDKRPLIQWQQYQKKQATASEVDGWLAQFNDFDIGVVTGRISGLLVVDVDGDDGRKSLDAAHVTMPPTWTVKTPRGWHYYFKWPEKLDGIPTTKVGVLPSVDLRGEGGYVVFYGWCPGRTPSDVELANAPGWLIDMVTNRPKEATLLGNNRAGWIAESLANLDVGNRHAAFAKIIGRFNRDGFTSADIVALLEPHAEACGLGIDELRLQVGKMVRLYADQVARPMTGMTAQQLLSNAKTTIPWLVQGLFPKEGVGILAGHPKIGKSWLTLDLSIAVSTGESWLSNFAVTPGSALYIDEESSTDMLGFRFRKLLKKRGLTDAKIQFHVKEGFNFSVPSKIEEIRRVMESVQPRLVVFDSLNRVHKAEENSASQMGEVFRKVSALAKEFGCFILFTDHLPHGMERFRGTSDKEAFVDVGLLAAKIGNCNMLVEHKYARVTEPVPSFELAIEDDGPDQTHVRWIG